MFHFMYQVIGSHSSSIKGCDFKAPQKRQLKNCCTPENVQLRSMAKEENVLKNENCRKVKQKAENLSTWST
ncbi:CLUMA_CG006096, isoform A [Clunio marinus]|uniref:CLUMA_CG006096, isoform A n=1 Tax=Clunio marinus TaxID=568069 RepID=A0A1J1HYZ6_9DIPT|nr:CLUMA_CG006096, isoform A [Clunio marinus]